MNIHAIQTGTVQVKKNQVTGKGNGFMRLLNVLVGREWVEQPVPIYAWVIEHEEGVIVVDTGETARTSEAGYFPRWHPYYNFAVRFHVRPEDEIGVQSKRMGIGSKDVKVVPTYGHTPAHVSVVVQMEDVYYFLAGDTSYSEGNLLNKVADGVGPDPNQAIKTMQNILNFASQHPTVYLPTHDPNSEKRLRNKTTLSIG